MKMRKSRLSVLGFLASFLITSSAFADACAKGLTGVFTNYQATKLCSLFSAGIIGTVANNTYVVARNAANSANINVWKVDATDDTVLNADSGDVIKLSVNGTSEVQVDDNVLYFTGTTDLLSLNTTDAADNGLLSIVAGGPTSPNGGTRGGGISLYGNENAGAGKIDIVMGGTSNLRVIGNTGATVVATFGGTSGGNLTINTGALIYPAAGIIEPESDPQRIVTFDGSSDTAITQTFGDSGVTAAQIFTISASTSDADDDSILRLAGGGAIGDSRGAWFRLFGNEASTAGAMEFLSGNVATGNISFALENASTSFIVKDTTSGNLFTISDAGAVTLTTASDLNFSLSGGTIAIQEATAGAACSGTLTCNGATDVTTSTTCATTGSRIFMTRSSADTDGVGQEYVKSISNGVNFVVNCVTANDTATYNWLIVHEAP